MCSAHIFKVVFMQYPRLVNVTTNSKCWENGFFNKNQAKQNHAFASVAAKIRRADFSVRTKRGEVLRLSIIRLKAYSARGGEYVQCTYF